MSIQASYDSLDNSNSSSSSNRRKRNSSRSSSFSTGFSIFIVFQVTGVKPGAIVWPVRHSSHHQLQCSALPLWHGIPVTPPTVSGGCRCPGKEEPSRCHTLGSSESVFLTCGQPILYAGFVITELLPPVSIICFLILWNLFWVKRNRLFKSF